LIESLMWENGLEINEANINLKGFYFLFFELL